MILTYFANEYNFVVVCTAKLKVNVARRANKLNKNVVMLKNKKIRKSKSLMRSPQAMSEA
jgi:hypothetical protein